MQASALRIFYVSHSCDVAGAEVVLLSVATGVKPRGSALLFQSGDLADALRSREVDVEVAVPELILAGARRRGTPKVRSLLAVALPLVNMCRRLRGVVGQECVVYANSQKAMAVCVLARVHRRAKLVWHLHDIVSEDHFGRLQILIAARNSKRAALVIVPSRAVGDALVAAGGDGSRMRVIHNGIPAIRQGGYESIDSVIDDGKFSPSYVVGVFSRLAHWKGQHLVLEALARLPDVGCLFVGSPQFGESDYERQLMDRVLELELESQVRFLGYRDDVPELMGVVDAYVHSSILPEPFSIVLLEAMQSGLPIIAPNAGGVPEAIIDECNGLLYTPGSVDSLVSAITRMRDNPDVSSRLGKQAALDAGQNFTESLMLETVEQCLHEVVGTQCSGDSV